MKLAEGFQLLATAPDGVGQLRELILSLALQGKLVPQADDDEPADHLLKRISAKKDRLIAEGRAKREKSPLGTSDIEEPFALPNGWEWIHLGAVVDIVRGITFPANEKTREAANGRIACLRTANIQREIEWDDLLFVDRSFMGRQEQLLELMDIVMSMANSRELVGKVAIVEEMPFPEATFGGFLAVLRPVLVEPRFVMVVLRTAYARSSLIDSASQTTNIANISLAKLRPLPIPIPPLAEQARIVAKVNELMHLCDELENSGRLQAEQHRRLTTALFDALATSESSHALAENWSRVAAHFDLLLDRPEAVDALEQTILQLAVRGLLASQNSNDEPAAELVAKIRAEKDRLVADGKVKRDKPLPLITDDDKPFILPVGWEWVRFDELNTPNKPISYGVLVPGPDVKTGVPFVRLGDLSIASPSARPEKTISPEVDAQYARTRLEGGEILMGVVGSIGKLGVAPESWKGANIARAICRIVPSRFVDKRFILLLLQSEFMQIGFSGDTRTLAQPTLNVGLIRCALTPLPPLDEQRRIAARVDELRRLCADLRARLAARQIFHARFAESVVEQATSTAPLAENTDDLVVAA
jgi:type I restriction enzyme, S subunit